jgi:hypothetical protein
MEWFIGREGRQHMGHHSARCGVQVEPIPLTQVEPIPLTHEPDHPRLQIPGRSPLALAT